jgi:hypothetical protein
MMATPVPLMAYSVRPSGEMTRLDPPESDASPKAVPAEKAMADYRPIA